MTDVVEQENTEVEETEAEETQALAVAEEDLPDLNKSLLNTARKVFAEVKAIVDRQNSVGDVGKMLSEAIENSEDAEVVKLRDKIERANKAILEATKLAEEKVKPTLKIPSQEELDKLETERKAKSQSFQAFATAFDVELARNGVTEKVTIMNYTGQLPGKRRGAKPGSGQGTSRPRLKSVEFTTDTNGEKGWTRVGDEKSSTFTNLLSVIKSQTGAVLSAADLHSAWLEQYPAAKGDWTELPEVSTFVYSVTGKDNQTTVYHIRATK